MDTELYQKFEEAFSLTLRNNPGILPGAPTVIESIKQALFKVQKGKATKENEMRRQLHRVKSEKETLQAQLRKEMGATALRRNELTKELDAVKREKDMMQESLTRQMEAIIAVKAEMKTKMDNVTREKGELTKHLSLLSKSRTELEQALEMEMKLVEKDRDALEHVVADRKVLQRQKKENKELEAKIEKMTEAASKEKRALQAEIADLKKFEEHVSEIRKNNEKSREELGRAKDDLKNMIDEMEKKKFTLMESKAEMEVEFQAEIDELEEQLANTRLVHEEEKETLVKNRVMSYLRRDGSGGGTPRAGARGASRGDIESIAKGRFDRKNRRTTGGGALFDSVDYDSDEENRGSGNVGQDKMRDEIDRLREELELVQARNPRNSTSSYVDRLRDEVRVGARSRRTNGLLSPRYHTPGAAGYTPGSAGLGYGSYEDEVGYRTPPLRHHHRTPGSHRLDSRYYF